jgi:rhodanese-related sulfurtransferase
MNEVPLAIDTHQLVALNNGSQPPVVLDVREPWERDITMIGGSLHIPMGSIPQRMGELPLDRQIVVLCHHGGRSAHVTALLRQSGFQATNLEGGIDAWSATVDPSLPRY